MFPQIRELALCESGNKKNPMGNPNAKNPNDTDGRPKYGLLQYGKWEFNTWSKLAGIIEADIWNPMHQIVTYRWAEENGLSYRWGCRKILINKGLAFLFEL